MMKAMEMNDLVKVVGGVDSTDLFLEYAAYLDMLFEKYGVRGVKNVKQVCTPEEREKIRQMWRTVLGKDTSAA